MPLPVPPIRDPNRPRRAPKPIGPLSGRRAGWRRASSMAMAAVNRLLDRMPPGRWLHQRAQRDLRFSEVDMTLHRGGAGLHGLRIAFLSDIHAGSFMNEADLHRIFAQVAARQPDLVCLGGDLINTREREILMFREALALLRPPLGIYAVPGNHDHFWGRDLGLWEAFLREQGVRVLVNRGERVERGGHGLWIAGVDDLTEGQPDLSAALAGRRDGEPVLLLSHHPDFFFESVAAGVDLTLSGHTHGGQVVVRGWTPLKHSLFGYWRGWFEEERARLYVSRGVGVTFLPLRLGASPEIPMVRLLAPAVETQAERSTSPRRRQSPATSSSSE